jgi:GTP pyrophosphokinase
MVSVSTNRPVITASGDLDVEAWLSSLAGERPPADLELIRRACIMAQKAHAGQMRVSGEPYIGHSLAVAQILAELRLDAETIVAALLHDVPEDTNVTLADIDKAFGHSVAALVDGVTKMKWIQEWPGPTDKSKKERAHVESLRKMLLAMAEDVRVVLIKLADRLHNMRTLGSLPEEKQKRIARETMDIFAPLANRLGIWQIKWELEDLSFRYLEPVMYKQIAGWLAERRADREQYIARFVALLSAELKKAGVDAEVTGRAKHIYGIWRKMQRKNLDFHQIFDVLAVRVLTKEVRDCYAALGIVHTLWQYVPGEFDDYIATPKENHYRSIHTAVIGPEGKTVEVQIRTFDMHQQSELGVAAHWRYKEGAKRDSGFDKKIAWLRQLLEWKDEVAEASDFVDQFKSEIFADRVYVFTPKGNIVDLPQGATPLDFAYHIHTEIGHRCRGAKINGHIVPLTYTLKSGEQVEVLTVKKGDPSRDWLNASLGYLKTSKARAKVQQWFRQENYDENVSAGRASLERELARLGLIDISYERLAQRFEFHKVDDFLAGIGSGDIKTSQIVGAVQEMVEPRAKEQRSLLTPQPAKAVTASTALQVQGVGNLLTRMARCCKPLPGDPIIGYISRGQGVTIHRRDCPTVLQHYNDSRERWVEAGWGTQTGQTYPVDVQIVAYDRSGLLRDISAVLANAKVNMTAVSTHVDRNTNVARIGLTLEIPDIDTLSRVLAQIDQLPNVTEVRRRVQ